MASSGGIKPLDPPSPSLFDVFYEELLTQMMENGGELNEKIPQEFMELTTDIQRVEFLLQNWSVVRDLRIKNRQNLKSFEKSTKFREEGNKLFQNEQTAQAILLYNKSLSCAPHPTVEEYLNPEPDNELKGLTQVKKNIVCINRALLMDKGHFVFPGLLH